MKASTPNEPLNKRADGGAAHPPHGGVTPLSGDAVAQEATGATMAPSRSAESSTLKASDAGAGETRTPNGWNTVAAVCLIVAVPCLLTGQINAAFVIATLGGVAWFLNVRSQLRRARAQSGGDESEDESESVED